ncbi:MAG: alpha/beta hydrolase [Planctomycetota bacterium]
MKIKNVCMGILTVILLVSLPPDQMPVRAGGIVIFAQDKLSAAPAAGESRPAGREKETPKPPEQPVSGPGGTNYSHSGVMENVYGEGDDQYWIFEPMSPTLKSAPLIVFNHGWGGMNPKIYGAWIEHLVKKGNIVVFPRYQADLQTQPKLFIPNAINAIKDAIKRLQGEGHISPELDRFGMVGHSMGGIITANIAALAKSERLPEPKAIMIVQPGATTVIELAELSKISSSTLMLNVVGDNDRVVGDNDAKKILEESTLIPAENKNLVIVVSDYYGKPALVANHFSPIGFSGSPRHSPNVNALDYYAYWKLFDALTNCAFYGKDSEYALGNTSQQRYMGKWSDGTPVKELVVIDQLKSKSEKQGGK